MYEVSAKSYVYAYNFILNADQTNKKIQQTHTSKVKKKKEGLFGASQPQILLSNMGAKVRQSHTSYTGSRSSIAIRHIGHFVHLSEQILQQQKQWHKNNK